MTLTSKAMLAYLWRKYPDHPNLLPAAMADDLPRDLTRDLAVGDTGELARDWVGKPRTLCLCLTLTKTLTLALTLTLTRP